MYNSLDIQERDLSLFTRAYIEAMFFTDAGPDNPELEEKAAFENFAQETVDRIISDCAAFELANKALLNQAGDDEQNGHDFWLTRNHHGAGFWDRGYPESIGEALTRAAHGFGEVSLCLGDSGKLYLI